MYKPISNIANDMGYDLEDFMILNNKQRELYYRDFIIKKMRHLINFNDLSLKKNY